MSGTVGFAGSVVGGGEVVGTGGLVSRPVRVNAENPTTTSTIRRSAISQPAARAPARCARTVNLPPTASYVLEDHHRLNQGHHFPVQGSRL